MGNHKDQAHSNIDTSGIIADGDEITTSGSTCKPGEVTMSVPCILYINEL